MKHETCKFLLAIFYTSVQLLIFGHEQIARCQGFSTGGLQSGAQGSGGDEKFSQLYPMVATPVMDGWNLLSIGVEPLTPLKSLLYPEATGKAFIYERSYVAKDSLKPGSGMWVKFSEASTAWMPGAIIDTIDIPVSKGWNIIGSISTPIPIASITSTPPGLTTSPFFGYNGAYVYLSTLDPGVGCWVKCNSEGTLHLSSGTSSSMANRIKIVPTNEMPPPPPSDETEGYSDNLPKEYALSQNYPNPFNPLTVIRYQLPVNSFVTLRIYDVLGREVKTLVNGIQDAGYESAEWVAGSVASGIYFYRLEAVSISDPSRSFTQVKKMLLLK